MSTLKSIDKEGKGSGKSDSEKVLLCKKENMFPILSICWLITRTTIFAMVAAEG